MLAGKDWKDFQSCLFAHLLESGRWYKWTFINDNKKYSFEGESVYVVIAHCMGCPGRAQKKSPIKAVPLLNFITKAGSDVMGPILACAKNYYRAHNVRRRWRRSY
jgi:hypothetical protein